MVLPNGPTLRPRKALAPAIRERVQQSLARLYGSAVSRTEPEARNDHVGTAAGSDLGKDGGPAEPAERRAFPRRDSACSVHICLVPGEEGLAKATAEWRLHAGRIGGPMIDVSLRSVALVLPDPLDAGQRALVRLTNRRRSINIDRRATTVRSVPLSEGEWKVICRFDEPLTLDELQHFGRSSFGSSHV